MGAKFHFFDCPLFRKRKEKKNSRRSLSFLSRSRTIEEIKKEKKREERLRYGAAFMLSDAVPYVCLVSFSASSVSGIYMLYQKKKKKVQHFHLLLSLIHI